MSSSGRYRPGLMLLLSQDYHNLSRPRPSVQLLEKSINNFKITILSWRTYTNACVPLQIYAKSTVT